MNCSQCSKARTTTCQCGLNFCFTDYREHKLSCSGLSENASFSMVELSGEIISKLSLLTQKLNLATNSIIKHVTQRSKAILERLEEPRKSYFDQIIKVKNVSKISSSQLSKWERARISIESLPSTLMTIIDEMFQKVYSDLGLEMIGNNQNNGTEDSQITERMSKPRDKKNTLNSTMQPRGIDSFSYRDLPKNQNQKKNKIFLDSARLTKPGNVTDYKNYSVGTAHDFITCSKLLFLQTPYIEYYKKVEKKYTSCNLSFETNGISIEANSNVLDKIKQELKILIEKFEFKDNGRWKYIGSAGYLNFDDSTNNLIEEEYRRSFPELIKDSYINYSRSVDIEIAKNFFSVRFAKFGGAHQKIKMYDSKCIIAVKRVSSSDYFDISLNNTIEWLYSPANSKDNVKKFNDESTLLLEATYLQFRDPQPKVYIQGENDSTIIVDIQQKELTTNQGIKCNVIRIDISKGNNRNLLL